MPAFESEDVSKLVKIPKNESFSLCFGIFLVPLSAGNKYILE